MTNLNVFHPCNIQSHCPLTIRLIAVGGNQKNFQIFLRIKSPMRVSLRSGLIDFAATHPQYYTYNLILFKFSSYYWLISCFRPFNIEPFSFFSFPVVYIALLPLPRTYSIRDRLSVHLSIRPSIRQSIHPFVSRITLILLVPLF